MYKQRNIQYNVFFNIRLLRKEAINAVLGIYYAFYHDLIR